MERKPPGGKGQYPNHESMRYELPIPYAPLDAPNDNYREGYDAIFGKDSEVRCKHHWAEPMQNEPALWCPQCETKLDPDSKQPLPAEDTK